MLPVHWADKEHSVESSSCNEITDALATTLTHIKNTQDYIFLVFACRMKSFFNNLMNVFDDAL